MTTYSTPLWWLLKDERISPTWRPCLPHSTIVLSYLTPHPETLNAILNGGNSSFIHPPLYDPSPNQQLSSTAVHIPTPVLVSASLSLLEKDGVPGDLSQDGKGRAETS